MFKCLLPTLCCLLLFSCTTKELQYLSFSNMKMVKLGYPKSTVGLEVTCYNPNKFGLRLESLNSDIYINGDFLGTAMIDSMLSVPRLDTFTIPVKMEVKMGNTLNSLLKVMGNSEDSVLLDLKMDGKARLKKGGIFLNYPIRYQEKKVFKF